MVQIVVLLSILIAGISAMPLEEGMHIKIVPLADDIKFEINPTRRQYETVVDGHSRSTVESPWTGTIPGDYGGNYGDLQFYATTNNGELYLRDTIINGITNQNVLVYYYRTIPAGVTIRDVKFLNFGRQRGYARSAAFSTTGRYVEGEILVPSGYEIRMFVEIYTS